MKTRIATSVLTLAFAAFQFAANCQVSQKLYQVTDEGKYYFTYWAHSSGEKAGVRYVTPRTFYLEGIRTGVIPATMTYKEFLSCRVDDLQALIFQSQQDVIAAMQRLNEPGIYAPFVNQQSAEPISEKTTVTASQAESAANDDVWITTEESPVEQPPAIKTEEDAVNKQSQNSDIPWMVYSLTRPGDRVTIASDVENADDSFDEEDYQIPWVVLALTHRGDAFEAPGIPGRDDADDDSEFLELKIALLGILEELMDLQDTESRKKYGKVYAGMDGKLYGSSDAELDELIKALLRMKDEISITANRKEVNEIFATLETLVSR
ncbi:MAG TPA: hypothetical protein VNJ07_12270 [Chitinophagales bacterium]|nr:hypothetical protein [Chitinophagales bacterium]